MVSIQEVYDKISIDFDVTRHKVWNCTQKFIESIDPSYSGLEVGCGNGKNMLFCKKKNLSIKGIDISNKFVEICQNKGLDVIQADMLNLPFENESLDFVFSIAVLHHLDSKDLRIEALKEMFRVCKPGSKIFVLVWAFELEPDSKRKFTSTDEMVSWKCREDGKIYLRYYHLYKEKELEEEFFSTNHKYKILDNFYEKGNWGIIVEKQ